jgi:acyl-CoA oxidase
MNYSWVKFDNYRIDRDALLNRSADVTKEGRYEKAGGGNGGSNFTPLSAGRVGIVGQGAMACRLASSIVVRYSAVRRQFGPDDTGEEWAVIEYPLQVFYF